MTRKTGILIGSILITLCAAAFVAGTALLITAHGMLAHTNESRAIELTIRYERLYVNGTQEDKTAVEREIASLRTPKWKLYNAGLTMCLTAPILLIAIYRFRLWDVRMLRYAVTPRSRMSLLVLAGAAWLALLPAFVLELHDEYARDDLTPTMDTGHGSAVMAAPTFFATTLFVLTAFGRYVVLRNARLPANLWSWDEQQPRRSLAWTIFYGLIACALVVLIAGAASGSPWFLPSLIVGLYVIASTRAALLNGDGRPPTAEIVPTTYKSTTT
ncbi:MAG: hypothetical protein GY844_08960 [Bradyrhizobium sp.]|nr:hypothetical protein [Bradyrhizobium sp.]